MYQNFTKFAMLAVIVVLIFAYIGKPTETPTPSASNLTQREVSAGRRVFMEECDTEPGFTEYCDCTYSYLIKTMTTDEIVEMGNMNEKELEIAIKPAVSACLDKAL